MQRVQEEDKRSLPIYLLMRLVCLFRGHQVLKVTEVWREWKCGFARKKHKMKRKSWFECDRCGKVLK